MSSTQGEPALEGEVADIGFRRLLELVASTDSTGHLDVIGQTAGVVYFADGEMTYASSESSVSLRHIVEGIAPITSAEWDEASSSGRPLESLVDTGRLAPTLLRIVLEEAIFDALFELELAGNQRFAFVRSSEVTSAVRFPVDQIVGALAERISVWREAARHLGSTADVVRVRPRLGIEQDAITISAGDWAVLSEVDGQRSLAAVVGRSGKGAFRAVSALHRLMDVGAVERVG